MDRMKRLVYIFVLLVLPSWAMGQQYQLLPNFYRPLDPSEIRQSNSEEGEKLDFNMTVGTGFTSFGGQSSMNSYLAPSIGYQVNPHLRLNFTGVIANTNALSSGNVASPANQGGFMPFNQNNNTFAISGEGIYQPNDRFYIRAGGEYAENSMAPFQLYPGNNQFSTDYKSVNFGMGYRISDQASISFQMRFSDGYDPFANPYARRNSFSPFYQPYPW